MQKGGNKILKKEWLAIILLFVFSYLCLNFKVAYAANLLNKSITLGTSSAGAVTSHEFKFNLPNNGTIGSIAFQYCDLPLLSDPCVAPLGLDASSSVLSTQTGQTGFTIHSNTVSNRIVISRPPALAGAGSVTYKFDNITNPGVANKTTFVRITIHSNIDATGAFVDSGVTAFSLSPNLGVNVYVPPYLTFCVGVTVDVECQNSGGLSVGLGILQASKTSASTTQFAGATNDNTGYSVSVLGTTMTSGNNSIANLETADSAAPGRQQFGINLRANSNPSLGQAPEGNGSLVPNNLYNSSNLFKFSPGDVIASTATATDYNRMTVTYIVNISPSQPAGLYSTTLTYVATASF